jgi:NADH:ubiquinone oxidoreductase subunit D
MEEMRQSRRIIQQAVDKMPDGPVNAKVPKLIKPPVGDYYHSIEGPKGEIGCYLVSDGNAAALAGARASTVLHELAGVEKTLHRTSRRGCGGDYWYAGYCFR